MNAVSSHEGTDSVNSPTDLLFLAYTRHYAVARVALHVGDPTTTMNLRRTLQRLERPLSARMTRVPLERFLREHATEEKTLDLGASSGPYGPLFPNRVSLDIVPAPGVHLIGDAHALPFRDASFRVLLATEVMEHLHTPALAIDEMFRVLEPGGTLLLTTRFLFPIHDAPGDYFRYTRFGLAHLLKRFVSLEIREEADAMGTLAILLQRLGLQADTLGWRPLRLGWFVLARIVARLSFVITAEYGEARGRPRERQRMMTSGYYVVCQRPADHPRDASSPAAHL